MVLLHPSSTGQHAQKVTYAFKGLAFTTFLTTIPAKDKQSGRARL